MDSSLSIPPYIEVIEEKIEDVYLCETWGPVVLPLKSFSFKMTNPVDDKEAEGIRYSLNVYDLKGYKTPSYDFGIVAYDTTRNGWYAVDPLWRASKFESGYLLSKEDIKEIAKTIDKMPVYKVFIYSDVGVIKDASVIINAQKEIIFEINEGFNSNGYEMSSESNQKFVDKILRDFPQILSTFKFVK